MKKLTGLSLLLALTLALAHSTVFAQGRWVKLAPLPSPRHGIAGAVIGDVAYFAGGAQGVGANGTSDQIFAFALR